MKKQHVITIALTALLLSACLSPVQAESAATRTESILLEGMEETLTTTCHESRLGYTMWIDLGTFQVSTPVYFAGTETILRRGHESPDGFQFQVRGKSLYDDMTPDFDAAAMQWEASLAALDGNTQPLDTTDLFSHVPSRGFTAHDEGNTLMDYIIDAGDGYYCVYVRYPSEAAEGYAARVLHTLKSFTPFP